MLIAAYTRTDKERPPFSTRVPLYPEWSWSSLNIAFVFFSSKVHNRMAYSAAARAVLHRQDGAEARLAVDDTLIRLRSLSQWVRLDYRFNFSLRYEIKGFVEIFGAVLLAANYPNALHDEVHQRDRKRLRADSHGDEPSVGAQPLNAVHHRLGGIGCAENDVRATRRGKALSVADNFIRAEIADHLVFIGGVRNRDGIEARSFRVLHR